jgi:hypothetical protein
LCTRRGVGGGVSQAHETPQHSTITNTTQRKRIDRQSPTPPHQQRTRRVVTRPASPTCVPEPAGSCHPGERWSSQPPPPAAAAPPARAHEDRIAQSRRPIFPIVASRSPHPWRRGVRTVRSTSSLRIAQIIGVLPSASGVPASAPLSSSSSTTASCEF